VPVDLSDRDQVADMVARTVAALGRLDVLVNHVAVTFAGDHDIPLLGIMEAAPFSPGSGKVSGK
jgi:NAD(P)-dependent dehydrogenase (short-subunit alcohol dehydrogenase family)